MFAARNMMFARAGGAFDADAADYFARIVTAGSTISTANKTAVNAFVVGCKADGIWSAIKASCILAGADTLAGALVPLVGPAPTNEAFIEGNYEKTNGLTGDASTKRLISNYSDDADPQDNAHASAWLYNRGSGTSVGFVSSSGGGSAGRCMWRNRTQCNSVDGDSYVVVTGFLGVSRYQSSEYKRRNGGVNTTIMQPSITPNPEGVAIFSRATTGGSRSNATIAFYSIGESLDLAQLDARLATLMGALT